MKKWYSLAVPLMLLAPPAWAGNDFCDGMGDTQITPPPGGSTGGSCEVSLIFDSGGPGGAVPVGGVALPRLRDMPLNESFYRVLSTDDQDRPVVATWDDIQINFKICSARLGDTPGAEVGLAEWSFESDDKSEARRVLEASLRREDNNLVLNLDWIIPPNRDWSAATDPDLEPVLIDTQRIKLGTLLPGADGFENLPYLYLRRKGPTVYVGTRDPKHRLEEVSFALPTPTWRPTLLRNGLLNGAQSPDGTRVHLSWPRKFIYVEVPPRPKPPEAPDPQDPVWN